MLIVTFTCDPIRLSWLGLCGRCHRCHRCHCRAPRYTQHLSSGPVVAEPGPDRGPSTATLAMIWGHFSLFSTVSHCFSALAIPLPYRVACSAQRNLTSFACTSNGMANKTSFLSFFLSFLPSGLDPHRIRCTSCPAPVVLRGAQPDLRRPAGRL